MIEEEDEQNMEEQVVEQEQVAEPEGGQEQAAGLSC